MMTFKIEDLDFDNIVIDEKSYENILVYNISYKILIDSKPLPIMFNKVDRFIRVCDGIRYLVLFGNKKNDAIHDKIRYLISQKNGITYIIWHRFARIKIDSSDSLPFEKTLRLCSCKSYYTYRDNF